MTQNRVLLIGVDQSIPYLLNTFVNEGILPNIKNLIETGTYTEGLSCVPCDTPTNWTTIATGATTSVHGATSFYTHIPGEEFDYGATKRSRSQLTEFTNAEYIWDIADKNGLHSFILNYPGGWPANLNHGVMSTFTWPIPGTLPQILKQNKIVTFSEKSSKQNFKIIDGSFTFKMTQNLEFKFKIVDDFLQFSNNKQKFQIQEGQWSRWFKD
jgi:predicted AlkP superfamily phosphohydrolase/phosphomutase